MVDHVLQISPIPGVAGNCEDSMLPKQAHNNVQSCRPSYGCTSSLIGIRYRNSRAASKRCESVSSALPLCPIPTGQQIAYVSKPDVAFLYREVYEKQTYLQHGVTISPGNTVLDVGANIGIFAAYAARKVGKRGLVIAVEPVPPTWEVLQYNMDVLQGPGDGQVLLINKGVGDGSREALDFTFYPAAAGWSTMYPDASEVSDAMHIFLERSLPSLEGMDLSLVNRIGSLAARSAPKWLVDPLSRLAVKRMLAQKKEYRCQLTTVSDIIQTQGLEVVDLLKVDVERAELDVLRGIADGDWPKIRQLVMEVHDVNGALGAVRELLISKGSFATCVVEQDTQLEGSTLYNLYATQQRT